MQVQDGVATLEDTYLTFVQGIAGLRPRKMPKVTSLMLSVWEHELCMISWKETSSGNCKSPSWSLWLGFLASAGKLASSDAS